METGHGDGGPRADCWTRTGDGSCDAGIDVGKGNWKLRRAWEMGIGSWDWETDTHEACRVDADRHYGDARRMLDVINCPNDGPIDKRV